MAQGETFNWQEPPPRGGAGRISHTVIAERLRANPGAWAHIGNYKTARSSAAMAGSIKRASWRAYEPKGAYEAHSRKVGDEYRVYARYIGEESSDE